jgi:hypothetical protein
MKLSSTAALETFSNARHNGYGGSLDLSGQPEIPSKRSLPASLINCPGQLPSFLRCD